MRKSPLFFSLIAVLMMFLADCADQKKDEAADSDTIQKTKKAADLEAPENVLKKFVTGSFKVKSEDQLRDLATFTTGEARKALENISAENLKKYYQDPSIELVDMNVIDVRKKSTTELEMEYRINYLDSSPGSAAAEFSNTKTAQLILEEEKWKVKNVKGLVSTASFREGTLIEIRRRPYVEAGEK